ncbi:MAG: iron-sulfur cluster assembly scaffold protein [Sphaerochaetaceae bacterium]
MIVEDDKIVDIKWQTYGCASAIASTSMMSEMVIGFTLEEAYKLSPKTIDEKLGGLP